MIGKLASWFLNQISLSGPFAHAVEKGWISPEIATWIKATFFAPLNFAAENFELMGRMQSELIEAWQQLPF